MNLRAQQRGFVLQTILGAIVVLIVAGTFLYTRTHDHLLMSNSVSLQSIAATRATLGVENAIAQLKRFVPPGLQSLTPCHISEPLTTCAGSLRVFTVIPLVDNGTADLSAGGGRQYQVDGYLRTNDAGLQPQLLLVSTGYYGRTGSENLLSSVVMVELSMPTNGSSGCTGYCGAN
jgi:hypothetical protein